MSLDPQTRERITGLIETNQVMLFMKGTPDAPGCGFSAQAVQILSGLISDFGACDVLTDPEIRSGIKDFSDWPTIPQLYVRGEFQGGCDIIKEMYATGELHQVLELPVPEVTTPTISITDAAAEIIRGAQQQSEHAGLHVMIDPGFQHQLGFGPVQPGEIEVQASGFTVYFDRDSATRADGLLIDLASEGDRQGLAVSNPNAPDRASDAVAALPVSELKTLMDAGADFALYDVRAREEWDQARIPGAKLVDEAVAEEIGKLPKDTRLIFHCHHGGRSQAAAEHFAAQGFTKVFNLVGGIDAWSLEIDKSVPRY
ncbi:MAG: Grx4 family monothiol glutaredoxin [bacterium]|nr:Grx4 family monothiol glutaredoxin [bacterium]